MRQRSLNQIATYHGLIKQIRDCDEFKVDLGTKTFPIRPRSLNKNTFRYLLKNLDLELPIRDSDSQNKNSFSDTQMADLSHHISWLKEQLYGNGLVPFDDGYLTKG